MGWVGSDGVRSLQQSQPRPTGPDRVFKNFKHTTVFAQQPSGRKLAVSKLEAFNARRLETTQLLVPFHRPGRRWRGGCDDCLRARCPPPRRRCGGLCRRCKQRRCDRWRCKRRRCCHGSKRRHRRWNPAARRITNALLFVHFAQDKRNCHVEKHGSDSVEQP